MKIFNWVQRKFNPKNIVCGGNIIKSSSNGRYDASLKGKKEEQCGTLVIDNWKREDLLSIGTLGVDGSCHHYQNYVMEEEEDQDITPIELEEFKKSLAKILSLEDPSTNVHNQTAKHNRDCKQESHSNGLVFEKELDGKEEPESQPAKPSFPLEEFLEIPVDSNNAAELKFKKKKNTTLGAILLGKKQEEIVSQNPSTNAINEKKELRKSGHELKESGSWVMDKIIIKKLLKRLQSSSQGSSGFSQLKIMLCKSLFKGTSLHALNKRLQKSVMHDREASSSTLSCESATSPPEDEDESDESCEEYYTLSRERSLGRVQEYWIKSNSNFVVLEL